MNSSIKTEIWDGHEIRFVEKSPGEFVPFPIDLIKALKLTTAETLASEGEYIIETLHIRDDYNLILTSKDNLFLIRHFYGNYEFPIIPNYVESIQSIISSENEQYKEAFKNMIFESIKINLNSPNKTNKNTENAIIQRLINIFDYKIENEIKSDASTEEASLYKKNLEKGFVYLIKADNGLIKIGKSNNLENRWRHFTVKLPYALELIGFGIIP